MRALVVYESMFGSTKAVAEAVADGLMTRLTTEVVEVSMAPASLPEDLDLLVVAAPTHAMSLSRPWSRAAAAKQASGPLVSQGIGLREWLDALEVSSAARSRCAAVAVDTRLGRRRPPGSAARRAQTRLWRKGVRVLASAETFWVGPAPGELLHGERARARSWGARLAAQVPQHLHGRSWDAHHTFTRSRP